MRMVTVKMLLEIAPVRQEHSIVGVRSGTVVLKRGRIH
jgi:hypothetical protein